MKNKILIISTLTYLIFILSCQKTITIKTLPYNSKLSIQSLITPDSIPTVYTYMVVPYFDTKVFASSLFRKDVVVTMTSNTQIIFFTLDSVFNIPACEYYLFWKGNKSILANTKYTINVTDNGTIHTATCTTNQAKVNIDSVSYVKVFKDVYGEHEGIIFHFKDVVNQENFYRYQMDRIILDSVINPSGAYSPCSIGQTNFVQELGRSSYPDKNIDGQQMHFVIEPTYKHKQGQIANVYLQSVDKNIYTFYDNLDRNKLAQYNPFVEPVFLDNLQFGSTAIGVFGAYAISDSSIFVYPE